MELKSNENAHYDPIYSNDISHACDNQVSDISNQGVTESICDTSEDVRGILEIIASTGKFWHKWDNLKNMLSSQLKKVLSDYPEEKMSTGEQNTLLGETYADLVKRLDEALLSFIPGPPFTLQRLCEILLGARIIYPDLSKLALALEKNLLVASTLTICRDPYPRGVIQNHVEQDKVSEDLQVQPELVENGVVDQDEIMTEVEESDTNDDMTIDMETVHESVSVTNSTTTIDS